MRVPVNRNWISTGALLLLAAGLALALFRAGASEATQLSPAAAPGLSKATFAGGCFWCMEQPFEALPGVKSVVSGYTGGSVAHVTYAQIGSGNTGHAEAVEVLYDPGLVGYDKLLEVFWHNIDPVAKDRQFCDRGTQYRSAIFVHDAAQRAAAQESLRLLQVDSRFAGEVIQTQIADAAAFYLAEDYHQDYAAKNPGQYKYYRWGCGRDARLKQIWGESAGH